MAPARLSARAAAVLVRRGLRFISVLGSHPGGCPAKPFTRTTGPHSGQPRRRQETTCGRSSADASSIKLDQARRRPRRRLLRGGPRYGGAVADHYFTAEPAATARRRRIDVVLAGRRWSLETAAGIFSPDHVDTGTQVLLNHAPAPPARDEFLDLGCGWGPNAP